MFENTIDSGTLYWVIMISGSIIGGGLSVVLTMGIRYVHKKYRKRYISKYLSLVPGDIVHLGIHVTPPLTQEDIDLCRTIKPLLQAFNDRFKGYSHQRLVQAISWLNIKATFDFISLVGTKEAGDILTGIATEVVLTKHSLIASGQPPEVPSGIAVRIE